MALTACPDCNKEFSTLAATCPHCGRPAGRQRAQEGFLHKVFRIIFIAVILLVVLSCGFCIIATNKGKRSSNSNSENTVIQSVNTTNQLDYVTPAIPAPTSDITRSKAYKDGYKVGLREGRHPNNPPTMSQTQIEVLLQAALKRHKPSEEEIWSAGFRKGFWEGYGGK